MADDEDRRLADFRWLHVARARQAPRRFRILLVDDEPAVSHYVAAMLQDSGFDCEVEVLSPRGARRGVRAAPGEHGPRDWEVGELWQALKSHDGWDCVNVAAGPGLALIKLMERDLARLVSFYNDIYYELRRPPADIVHRHVRQMAAGDLGLLAAAPAELRGRGSEAPGVLFGEGRAAGAIVGGRLVAMACAHTAVGHYADLDVYTLEGWRRRGLAAAAASIVCRHVQERGLVPTWRTEQDNVASRRVATKLGFTEVSCRTYIVPNRRR